MALRAQIDKLLEQLRSSYWFVPAVMALAAIVLSFVSTSLDRWLGPEWLQGGYFVAASRPDGARAILTAIGGSMIGVAGTVFSVTMAAVVYASGQYGPRLLTNFLSDRGNQITLGTFTATFVFAIMVLRTIQSPNESKGAAVAAAQGFVPHLALIIAIALALCSIAVLIFFIHHVPTRIHISNVIRDIGETLLEAIDERYPKNIGFGAADRKQAEDAWWQLPAPFRPGRDRRDEAASDYGEVLSTMRGYIQFLDEKTLMSAARRHTVVVRLNVRPGSFLFDGALVCDVWPAERLTDAVSRDILSAIATGARRTPADDMLFMVDELVEIAARALSPGVNDPFTAVGCIDWVSAALAELADRPTPDPLRTDEDGKLRIVAEPLGFGEYLRLSLGAIREYAAGDKITAVHFLRTLELIGRRCRKGAHVLALTREADDLVELSRTRLTGPSLREVQAEADIVREALSHARRRRPFPELDGLADRNAHLPPPEDEAEADADADAGAGAGEEAGDGQSSS